MLGVKNMKYFLLASLTAYFLLFSESSRANSKHHFFVEDKGQREFEIDFSTEQEEIIFVLEQRDSSNDFKVSFGVTAWGTSSAPIGLFYRNQKNSKFQVFIKDARGTKLSSSSSIEALNLEPPITIKIVKLAEKPYTSNLSGKIIVH